MKDTWEACGVEVQAKILAYDQTMQHDEDEREAQLAGARKPFGGSPSKKPAGKKPAGKKRGR